MKEEILARRYAQALFEIAQERQLLEKVRTELHHFAASLEENQAFADFFRSPEHSRAVKRAAIEKVFQDRYSNVFFNFLVVVIQKGRHQTVTEIVAAFDELYDRFTRRTRALAITAVPLDSKIADDLKVRLSKSLNKQVDLENQIDPAILGGIVLNIDGKVLDGSVKQQLERLRAQFLENRN